MPQVSGLDKLPGKSNYFLGNDPKKWRTNVPNYANVRYENVYPGIDLVFHGKESEVTSQKSEGRGPLPVAQERQLEYDFVVAPGADPQAIRFALETGKSGLANPEPRIPNPGGLRIAANGDLVIHLNGGEVRFRKPVIYQPAGHQQSAVSNNGRRTTDHGHRTLARIQNSQFRIQNLSKGTTFCWQTTVWASRCRRMIAAGRSSSTPR